MKSLEELNQYALSPITYIDDRPAGVFFDRGATVDQEISVNENTTFFFPYGIEIEDITQYDVAQMEYVIDLSVFDPQVVYVDFPDSVTLPAHITVTRVGNVFTISEIRNKADWDLVKTLRVQPPFSVSGFKPLEGKLRWFADGQAVTRTEAVWDVQLELVPVEYFSAVAAETYVANQQDDQIEVPSIIVDPDEFDPEWTLEISPSVLGAVELIYSTNPSEAETSWNASTRTFSIIGDKTSVNNTLEDLEVDYGRSDADFIMTYLLRNNYNLVTENQVQTFESRDFITDMDAEGAISATLHTIFGGEANFTPFTTFDDVDTTFSRTRDPNPTTLANVSTWDIDEWLVKGAHLSVPGSNDIRANETTSISNAPQFEQTYPGNIDPTFTVVITNNTPSRVVELTTSGTQGTVTWNNTTKTLTLVGTKDQLNPHLSSLTIETDEYVSNNIVLTYTTTWDFVNPYTQTRQQTLSYIPDVSNLTGPYTYETNVQNDIFSGANVVCNNSNFTNFTVVLTTNQGEFYDGTNLSNSITISGTKSVVDAAIATVEYYQDYNVTTNATVSYTVTKDGVAGSRGSFALNNSGTGNMGVTVHRYKTAGSYTWEPSIEEQKYGKMTYVVVGGGGGGGWHNQIQQYYTDQADATFTFNGNAAFDSTTKKFGSHSISFDGTNSYLTANDDVYVSTGRFEAWIKIDDTSVDQTIWDFRDLSSGTGSSLYTQPHRFVYKNSKLQVLGVNSAVVLESGTSDISQDTWHHVMYEVYAKEDTNQGSNISSSYKIGALFVDGTRVDYNAFIIIGSNPNNDPVEWDNGSYNKTARIGASIDGSEYFNGNMDEILFAYLPNVDGYTLYPASYQYGPEYYLFNRTPYANFTPNTVEYRWDESGGNTSSCSPVGVVGSGFGIVMLHCNDIYPNNVLINEYFEISRLNGNNTLGGSPGGGGGDIKIAENQIITASSYSLTVGAGGDTADNTITNRSIMWEGTRGGTTTFNALSADGGYPGIGLSISTNVWTDGDTANITTLDANNPNTYAWGGKGGAGGDGSVDGGDFFYTASGGGTALRGAGVRHAKGPCGSSPNKTGYSSLLYMPSISTTQGDDAIELDVTAPLNTNEFNDSEPGRPWELQAIYGTTLNSSEKYLAGGGQGGVSRDTYDFQINNGSSGIGINWLTTGSFFQGPGRGGYGANMMLGNQDYFTANDGCVYIFTTTK